MGDVEHEDRHRDGGPHASTAEADSPPAARYRGRLDPVPVAAYDSLE